jgi:ABC-2 type transport system ATP-binding protein
VALVAALASDAELLMLDEPTSGLDPLMEAVFRQCAEEERARGRTVLLSSHILSEVEALCDRVTIIRAGRTVETGTLTELRHLTRTSIAAELGGLPRGLDQLRGVHDLVVDPGQDGGSRVRCEVDSDRLEDVLRALVTAGVRTLVSQPPTLEELFLRHYAADADAGAVAAIAGASGQVGA